MKYPSVTIILPVRNEALYIERCLSSIISQDYEGEMEIFIADGISTDNTQEIIQKFRIQNPSIKLLLLDNPNKIVSNGINIALSQAKGQIIIRVDGHCIIANDYVKNCVQHILNDRVDGVGGSMDTIGETQLSETIAIAMSSQFGVGNSAFRTMKDKSLLSDTVPFPAYTAEIIQKIGLYDEELVRDQDDEYNYRLREVGGKLLLASDVKSVYYSRGSLSGLWKQYFQYGYYKVRVLQKHPLQMSPRQFVPLLFVLGLIFSLLLSFFQKLWPLFIIVPGAYILANLAASLLTSKKAGWQYFRMLPIVFSILHVSYGFGFLVGLFKFWNRWGDKKGKVPDFKRLSQQDCS